MSTTSRSSGSRHYFKCASIQLLGLLIVINYATAIDYAAYRKDTIPRGISRQKALTTRNILEDLNLRNVTSSDTTLQKATEHMLRYGALLRTQILDTFGKLVYDHYDDFGMSQIEALYRIYRETLERKYNIFDIVPSILEDPDTRPTKICAHINEHVRTFLKESSNICMNIKIHNVPHVDTLAKPALNLTRRIYQTGKIAKNYPNGFSVKAILRHLRAGHLRFTSSLFSGLLHNVQYDNFDDKVRTAERELVTYLDDKTSGPLISKKLEKASIDGRTVSELLRNYLTRGEKFFHGKAANHAAYLSRHVVREIDAVSQNIELLGTAYDNSTINLKYLFELILSNDTVDRDILEARDYLRREIETKKIIETYLSIEKYQQTGPDQLLLEILGQLRDIHFAENLATSLYVHASFWHKNHMIENLNELLDLFDAYENLRGLTTYRELMKIIDSIKNNLRDSRNVTVELLCSRPRDCLRIGLEKVANCAIVNDITKRAIDLFIDRTTCGCSCLAEDSSNETMKRERTNYHDDVESSAEISWDIDENSKDKEYTENTENSRDIVMTTIASVPDESLEIMESISSGETREESTEKSCENDCLSSEVEINKCIGNNCTTIQCIGDNCNVSESSNSTKLHCVGSDCSESSCENGDCDFKDLESDECEGSDCFVDSCEGDDCKVNSTLVNGPCVGPDCREDSRNKSTDLFEKNQCHGSDCPIKNCTGNECGDNSTKICNGPDCGETLKVECKDGDCPISDSLLSEVTGVCNGTDCPKINCTGDSCPGNETLQKCEGPDCSSNKLKREEASCEGANCLDNFSVESDCEGSGCSDNDDEAKEEDCEGSDCSESNDEKKKENCEGVGCLSGETDTMEDCEGKDCPKEEEEEEDEEEEEEEEEEENDCEGSDCSIDEQKIIKDCEGEDCPVGKAEKNCEDSDCISELHETTSVPCTSENCTDTKVTCIGDNCTANSPSRIEKIEQIEESMTSPTLTSIVNETSDSTSAQTICDNRDPYYRRMLHRLRKVRLIDALSSKPRSSYELFNGLIGSSTDEKTKIADEDSSKMKITENRILKTNVSEETALKSKVPEKTSLNRKNHEKPIVKTKNHEKTSLSTKNHEKTSLSRKNHEKTSLSTKNQEKTGSGVKNRDENHPLIEVLEKIDNSLRSAIITRRKIDRKPEKYNASRSYQTKKSSRRSSSKIRKSQKNRNNIWHDLAIEKNGDRSSVNVSTFRHEIMEKGRKKLGKNIAERVMMGIKILAGDDDEDKKTQNPSIEKIISRRGSVENGMRNIENLPKNWHQTSKHHRLRRSIDPRNTRESMVQKPIAPTSRLHETTEHELQDKIRRFIIRTLP